MAKPLSASKTAEGPACEGLTVHEVRNWRTHNRNQGPLGPGERRDDPPHRHLGHRRTPSTLCYDGYASLPGPLCHGVIDKKGEVHLVGNGRANHAGLGDDDVLRAVINETEAARRQRGRHGRQPPLLRLRVRQPRRRQGPVARGAEGGHREGRRPRSAAHHGWTRALGHRPQGVAAGQGGPARLHDGLACAARIGRRVSGGKPAARRSRPRRSRRRRTSRSPAPRSSASGRHSPIITAMGKRLVAEGCGRYEEGPGPEWTEADRKSYAAWQRKLGFSGEDADGIPGKASWDKLRVPNV